MGRVYAGILGSLAFATVLLRGALQGSGTQATLVTAMTMLVVFAAVGWVAGQLAGWIVEQSVRSQLTAAATAASASRGDATSRLEQTS